MLMDQLSRYEREHHTERSVHGGLEGEAEDRVEGNYHSL